MWRRKRLSCGWLAALVLSVALPGLWASSVEARSLKVDEAIEAANKAFMAAFARQDAAAVAAQYTADAVMLPPGQGPVSGTEAIREFWQAGMSVGITGVELASSDVEVHGRLAIETGNYKLYNADGDRLDEGKYLVVWVSEKGGWKLYRDIWNSNVPAAGE